jgi:hypothetical protein
MKLMRFSFMAVLSLFVLLTACNSDKKADDSNTVEAVSAKQAPANKANVKPTVTNNVPDGPKTKISFEDLSYDFGTITDGEKVRHTFKFKNDGAEPLLISNCKASCGCTVPQCPKNPIAPGEAGEITIEYNSKGKSRNKAEGQVDQKIVQVIANTDPGTTRLTVKAKVMPDPNAPKKPAVKKPDAK